MSADTELEKSKVPLSIYLIRPSAVVELEKAFSSYEPVSIVATDGFEGSFYALPSEPNTPKWFTELQSILGPNLDDLVITSQVAGGLIVIKSKAHVFAVSFGTGWLRLSDDWLESDFGRKVALNAVPPDKLIELRAEQVFARRHVASERAPVASNRHVFGVDFDRDLLGAVEGVPTNAKHLGSSVCGGVSLRIKIPIPEIFTALQESAALYASTAYQRHWPEVDNLTRVTDSATIIQLDGLLDVALGNLASPQYPILVNSGPRREDEHAAAFFAMGTLPRKPKGGTRPGAPYLMLGAWDTWLNAKREKRGLLSAKNTTVFALDAGGEELYRTNIYNCLAFEASLGVGSGVSRPYILSQGSWYQTNANFVSDVEARLQALSKCLPSTRLSVWNRSDHEGAYNLKNVSGSLVHFDAKNVSYGGGSSRFEFCDLMDPATQTLYFVKIASNSSHMSHLAEQVRRTAELFFSPDPTFRGKLAAVVKKHHPQLASSWVTNRPAQASWHLCLVPLGRSLMELPFFAKCGVYRLAKELESRGHSLLCDER